MKDGKRSKKESATIEKKASGSKKRVEASGKSKVSKASSLSSKAASKTNAKSASETGGKKRRSESNVEEEAPTVVKGAKGNGRTKEAASESGRLTFTNPVVESAFNRALKKYATALKHLSD